LAFCFLSNSIVVERPKRGACLCFPGVSSAEKFTELSQQRQSNRYGSERMGRFPNMGSMKSVGVYCKHFLSTVEHVSEFTLYFQQLQTVLGDPSQCLPAFLVFFRVLRVVMYLNNFGSVLLNVHVLCSIYTHRPFILFLGSLSALIWLSVTGGFVNM
jgi:hypothetical protein